MIAPGKLIVSGEYSVMHQKPALCMAINKYIKTQITATPGSGLTVDLLGKHLALSFDELKNVWQRITSHYALFLKDQCPITDILKKPEELALACIANFLQTFNLRPETGFHVEITSTLPVASGMGSSAALIVSLLLALSQYFNKPQSNEVFLKHAILLENLQHGHSSGLDIHTSFLGGCVYSENTKLTHITPPALPFYSVNTGKPLSSTGECVAHAQRYKNDAALWEEFAATTKAIKIAYEKNEWVSLKKHFMHNHRLLVGVGAVPLTVQAFIRDIEQARSAAKISGAGAVRGDTAGMVLIVSDNIQTLNPVCKKYGFQYERVTPETKGAQRV